MTEANVEIARRGYEAVLRGDFDAVREFLHPDVKWHGGDPDAVGACRNRRQALDYMRKGIARRGAVSELVDVVSAGDRVVVILKPADGDQPVANVTTFRDGKAIEMVHFPDVADALAAVGL